MAKQPPQRAKTAKPTKAKAKKQSQSNVIDLRAARDSAEDFGRNFWHRLVSAQSWIFYQLAALTIFLSIFGVVMVLSSSYVDSLQTSANSFTAFNRQILAIGPGFIAMAGLSLASVEWFRRRSIVLLGLSLLFQALTVTGLGVSVNGNRNWLHLGPVNVQPSEFLKIAMILALANFLFANENRFAVPATWWKSMILPIVCMAAVIAGADLGTVIVMALITLVVLGIAGMPRRIMGVILSAGALVFAIAVHQSPSRLARFMVWLNPSAPDPNQLGWQSQHGIWALAAGGIGGVGLGNSKLKWSWIPEAQNDFIFAIISEEEGLLGAVTVIALFIYMGLLFKRIAERTVDIYSRSVVIGVGIWIVGQALVNIAVVLNLLPVLGVPLPLISAGGSSLAANLVAIGIVLSIERENQAREVAPPLFRRRSNASTRRQPVLSKR
jgi:cell division protein FtsW